MAPGQVESCLKVMPLLVSLWDLQTFLYLHSKYLVGQHMEGFHGDVIEPRIVLHNKCALHTLTDSCAI